MSSTNNNGPTTSSSSQLSLPVHYLTLDGGSFIQCKCTDSKYTILVLSQGTTVYLSGVFSFQVLYGFVEVNGFLFTPKKYNPANFVPTCIPMGHMPASFAIRNELSIELHVERIQSRLREFINDPRKVIAFVEERKPVAILLIRLENVITAKLIQQQMPQNIFPPIGKVLGNRLYFANPAATELLKWMTLDEFEAHKRLANEQQTVVNRIYQNVEQDGKCIVFLAGNKGAGKSTMARYLLNALNSGVSDQPPKPGCRTFLLDADVGQSELCPPGCVSMCEVKNPLIGAPFASPLTTLPLSYFFGAISPGVDMDFYVKLVGHLLDKFNAQLAAEEEKPQENQQKFVLIVNSVGWIEDLGYDLMLRLLRLVKPTILVNLEINWMLNFTVPDNYRRITTTIRRTAASSDQKLTAPQLRNFMMAGYLAQTFLQTERPFLSVLRLAELPAYRVRFSSTAIYMHPEMRRIDDKLLLPFLNCAFVALCRVEQGFEKHFVHKRLLDNPSMPSRLEFQQALPNEDQHQLMSSSRESDQQHSNDNVDDANTSADFADADDDSSDSSMDVIPVEEQLGAVPMLRCLGFGLIRAINPQRKLFYVVTPTDPQALRRVNVFACGHSLNVPEMLFFDANVNEPAPYIVELDGGLRDDYRKFFSPLRNITGGKRAFQAKRGQHYEKK